MPSSDKGREHAAHDDDALQRARHASEEARRYAELADPLEDGSYAGDSSKSGLVDTPDLEEHDHRVAGIPEDDDADEPADRRPDDQ